MTAIFALVWSAVTSKLAGPIGLAASVALGIALAVADVRGAMFHHEAQRAEASRDAALGNLARAQDALSVESAAIDRQNGAVTALQAESAARSAEATKAATQARAVTLALSAREAVLSATKPTADSCADVDQLLKEGAK